MVSHNQPQMHQHYADVTVGGVLERGILELLILHSGTYDHSDISYFSHRWHVADAVHRCDITVTYIHLYVSAVCISVLYAMCVRVPADAGV